MGVEVQADRWMSRRVPFVIFTALVSSDILALMLWMRFRQSDWALGIDVPVPPRGGVHYQRSVPVDLESDASGAASHSASGNEDVGRLLRSVTPSSLCSHHRRRLARSPGQEGRANAANRMAG